MRFLLFSFFFMFSLTVFVSAVSVDSGSCVPVRGQLLTFSSIKQTATFVINGNFLKLTVGSPLSFEQSSYLLKSFDVKTLKYDLVQCKNAIAKPTLQVTPSKQVTIPKPIPTSKTPKILSSGDPALCTVTKGASGKIVRDAITFDVVFPFHVASNLIWSSNFSAVGQSFWPAGVSVSPDGKFVYVTDEVNSRVVVLSRDVNTGVLSWSSSFGSVGSGVGQFSFLSSVIGVVVSPDGKFLYVSDVGNGRVVVLSRDVNTGVLSWSSSFGSIGGRQLYGIFGVVVSPDGKFLYVLDASNGRVVVLSRNVVDGSLSWSSFYGFIGYIAEGVSVSPDGKFVYVTDASSGRVVVLSRDVVDGSLSWSSSFGSVGGVGQFYGSSGVSVSPDGKFVYVTDEISSRVVVLSRDVNTGVLSWSSFYGSVGSGVGQFYGPSGVSVSPDGKFLYVADLGNRRIVVLTSSYVQVQSKAFSDAFEFDLKSGGKTKTGVFYMDLSNNVGLNPGENTLALSWSKYLKSKTPLKTVGFNSYASVSGKPAVTSIIADDVNANYQFITNGFNSFDQPDQASVYYNPSFTTVQAVHKLNSPNDVQFVYANATQRCFTVNVKQCDPASINFNAIDASSLSNLLTFTVKVYDSNGNVVLTLTQADKGRRFSLPKGTYKIVYSSPGYEDYTETLTLDCNQLLSDVGKLGKLLFGSVKYVAPTDVNGVSMDGDLYGGPTRNGYAPRGLLVGSRVDSQVPATPPQYSVSFTPMQQYVLSYLCPQQTFDVKANQQTIVKLQCTKLPACTYNFKSNPTAARLFLRETGTTNYLWIGFTNLNLDLVKGKKYDVKMTSPDPQGTWSPAQYEETLTANCVDSTPIVYEKTFTHPANQWYIVNANPGFSSRYGHSTFILNGKAFLVAGRTQLSNTDTNAYNNNDVWSSVDGVNWKQETSSAQFYPRWGQSVFVLNNKAFLVGGVTYDATKGGRDVWSSTDGVNWKQELVKAPFGFISQAATVVLNGKVFLIGGQGPKGPQSNGLLKTVWSSIDGVNWKLETSNPGFTPRSGASAFVLNNMIYVMGGSNSHDVWSSTNGVNWRLEASSFGFFTSVQQVVLSLSSSIVFVSGRKSITESSYEHTFSSGDGRTWSGYALIPGFGWTIGASGFVLNGRPFVVGGYDFGANSKVWTINK